MNQRYISANANTNQGLHIQSQLALELDIRRNPDRVWLVADGKPPRVLRACDIDTGDVYVVSSHGERQWTVHVLRDDDGRIIVR